MKPKSAATGDVITLKHCMIHLNQRLFIQLYTWLALLPNSIFLLHRILTDPMTVFSLWITEISAMFFIQIKLN